MLGTAPIVTCAGTYHRPADGDSCGPSSKNFPHPVVGECLDWNVIRMTLFLLCRIAWRLEFFHSARLSQLLFLIPQLITYFGGKSFRKSGLVGANLKVLHLLDLESSIALGRVQTALNLRIPLRRSAGSIYELRCYALGTCRLRGGHMWETLR
jgi:hypothetical protein